jgi:uncharacterized membrane protein YfcA
LEINTALFIVGTLVAFFIGLSKGGLGGTLGAVATPLLAFVLPADKVIGLLLPILIFADIFAVAFHWGHWKRKYVFLLLPGAVIGVTIGTYFITSVPTETLRRLLGIIILLFASYKLFEKQLLGHLTYRSHNWHGVAAGTIAGFSSALAHVGGPPVSIYLLLQNVTPRVFIATNALFFAIVNWIKVPYYLYADLFDFELVWQMAWMLPLVVVGVWIGRWGAGKVNSRTYERIILILLVISALLLIFTG